MTCKPWNFAIKSLLKRMNSMVVTAKLIFLPKSLEPDLCDLVRKMVKPGWICVDVGANVGGITRILASQVGSSGRVIAFEAYHKNVKILKLLSLVFGYRSTIRAENIAISDGSQRVLDLYPGRESSHAEWNIVGHDVDGTKKEAVFRVISSSLDQYFPQGSRIDFIKIDIEGAEALALRGMRRILQESRPVVFVEFHDEDGWSGRKELIDANYVLYESNGRKLDPGKDIMRIYHCLSLPLEKEGIFVAGKLFE